MGAERGRYGLGVDGADHDDADFVWEVGRDLIDLDQWARVYVALHVEKKESERSAFVRYGYGPIMALLVIVTGATQSVGMAVAWAVFIGAAFGGAKLRNRRAAARLASRLRNLPVASEPFTFRAGPSGTHGESTSGSQTLSWSRYKSVCTFEDLLVLTQDTDVVLLVPERGLASGQSTTAAVAAIRRWIEAARPSVDDQAPANDSPLSLTESTSGPDESSPVGRGEEAPRTVLEPPLSDRPPEGQG